MNTGGRDGNGDLLTPAVIAKEILDMVALLRSQQDTWNAEMHRFFVTEKEQQNESDSLTKRVQSAEAESWEDEAFHDWMSRRARHGVGRDMIQDWFHKEDLISKTPFMAIAPCPRGLSSEGQEEVVKTLDALELPRFLVQTVPLHLPLSKLAPTFVPSAFHLPEGERASKSSLGALSYVGTPCTYGWDVMHLIEQQPMLAAALDRTPCLFLNDYVPRGSLCAHCAVIGGLFVAAEVACDLQCAGRLCLDRNDDPTQAANVTHCEFLSNSMKDFIEKELVSTLRSRSFRALIIGKTSTDDSYNSAVAEGPPPENYAFSLLNIESVDGSDFECFSQEDILNAAKHGAECLHEGTSFTPVLRFLRPTGGRG
uniref:Uncharacterized protein TCIL3000_11_8120 n=1 Tax=Trypanosoma congolense (strain IL3000) TaxID=1068625 RepID=G0V141_TRYCI|nr:unnamed protein product [Trypanosoma congolense IL3000]